jgi:polysaccharide pyruvyl transferase WcaK-like protein
MGGAAITSVLVKLLKNNVPNATVVLMPSRWRDRDVYVNEYGMRDVAFVRHVWYRERYSTPATLIHSAIPALDVFLRLSASSILRKFKVACNNPFDKYDAIIDLNSDAINEHYGTVFPLYTLFNLLLASLSGKPVIVCPCTIGRFRKPLRYIVKFVLNRMNLIMVREEIGRRNLRSLGVSKPKIAVVADLAFLFEAAQNSETLAGIRLTELERPIVGIAPSQEISRYAFVQSRESSDLKYEKYVKLMAQIADFVIESLNASVVLIPHSLSEKGTARYRWLDDRIMCKRVHALISNKEKTRLTEGPFRPDELKALIGACDLFIGCRMHATIASTSSIVPTVTVAYGEKFEGIIGRLMGQQDRIVNIGQDYETVFDQLKSKIVSTWENRDNVRQTLKQRLKFVQSSSSSAIPLIQMSLRIIDYRASNSSENAKTKDPNDLVTTQTQGLKLG